MLYTHYEFPKAGEKGEFEIWGTEGSILLRRRKELKMTQQQAADKSGIQLRQYQRLESGERNISASSGRIMLSICETLRLDPYVFLEKGNDEIETKYIVLPPIELKGITYAIPAFAYYLIVSAIPRGMVCTSDDILSCLRKAYGNDNLEIKPDENGVMMHADKAFPYWRVVSQRGYLINSFYCSKEWQMNLLKEEGVTVSQVGENESYRVDEFEYRHFPIERVKITVMKTMQQMLEEFQKNSKE